MQGCSEKFQTNIASGVQSIRFMKQSAAWSPLFVFGSSCFGELFLCPSQCKFSVTLASIVWCVFGQASGVHQVGQICNESEKYSSKVHKLY